MLSRLGDVADIPNTHRQAQRNRHNKETENIFKPKNKTKPQGKRNEMEISSLPNKKFQVIQKLTTLRRRMDELTENFDRETENIKKNQSELKNTITEMKIH